MSIDRQLSNKKLQNINIKSRPGIIDTLVNQKLSGDKQLLRSRLANILKRNQQHQREQKYVSQKKIRKRQVSLKHLSIQKIQQSLNYNPLQPFGNNTDKFIISRQHYSPLLSSKTIQNLITLRQNPHQLQTKLANQHNNLYQLKKLSQSQMIHLKLNVKQSINSNLWLPQQPYVSNVMDRLGQINRQLQFVSINNVLVKSSTFNNYGLQQQKLPIKRSSMSIINKQQKVVESGQDRKSLVSYDFKKYHKNDYISLQKWFEQNIMKCHSLQKRDQLQKGDSLKLSQKEKQECSSWTLLNNLYTIHISSLQQLIRLTYIQSYQKALLTQKLLWSLIRLFSSLIQEQHKINYQQYKVNRKQVQEVVRMYKDREIKLQQMMLRAQKQANATLAARQKLAIAYITYSRVNRHLYQELEFVTNQLRRSEAYQSYTGINMMKIINFFQDQGLIKIIQDQSQTTYYYSSAVKMQKLLSIATQQRRSEQLQLQQYEKHVHQKCKQKLTQRQLLNLMSKKRQQIRKRQNPLQTQTRVGDKIRQVQNQLNRFWLLKEDGFKIKQIIQEELIDINLVDVGISTMEVSQTIHFAMQFPQYQQKSFSQFLKQEINKERQTFTKQKQQQNDLYISLNDLYQESFDQIKKLTKTNQDLKQNISKKEELIKQKNKRIYQLEVRINMLSTEKQESIKQIQTLKYQSKILQETQSIIKLELSETISKLSYERQNNKSLIKTNLQSSQKIEKINFKIKNSQIKIKTLQQKIIQVQNNLLIVQKQKEQFQHIYMLIDNKLKSSAPIVDKFLQFQKYDKEPIIKNLKICLQRQFDSYFVRDTLTFGLTKG